MPYLNVKRNISFFAILVIDIFFICDIIRSMKYFIRNHDLQIFQNLFYDTETYKLLSPIETQNYTIIQVAESRYNQAFSIKKHRQLCDLEITFSHLNGLLSYTGDKSDRVDKDHAHVMFKGETHAVEGRRSHFQTLAINFKAGPCLALLDAVVFKAKESRTFYMPNIETCFADIINEFRFSDATFSELKLDSLITSVLVNFARIDDEKTFEQILSYDETLTEIKRYLDAHFLRIMSLEQLSKMFGYTYSYISREFKKAYGLTPKAYITQKKTEYACVMLKNGVKLDEIAETLGYASSFNFSRAFKFQTGISPSKYRKQ